MIICVPKPWRFLPSPRFRDAKFLRGPRDSKHDGETQRGTTREPQGSHRGEPKKKSMKRKRKQNKRSQFILKLKSFILNNIFQQSLSRHSVDHFKTIAMIFGHMFPMFFLKNVAKQRFLSVKSFYHRF